MTYQPLCYLTVTTLTAVWMLRQLSHLSKGAWPIPLSKFGNGGRWRQP